MRNLIKIGLVVLLYNAVIDEVLKAFSFLGNIIFNEMALYTFGAIALIAMFVIIAHKTTNAFINRHFL